MEKLIAEFNAKSHFVESLDRGLFFSWDLYERAKNLGVVIDAHALADPERCRVETIKLLYVCLSAYDQVSQQLGIGTKEPMSIDIVSGWVAVRPDEAAEAMRYITEQLTTRAAKIEGSKKKDLTNEN